MNYQRFFQGIGIALLAVIVSGCGNVQIDRQSFEQFNEGNYQTYHWKLAPMKSLPNDRDRLAAIDTVLRAEIDARLASKGYRRLAKGGDFVINYEFKASFTDGELTTGTSRMKSIPPLVINREIDGAYQDNANALAGVKELKNILVTFEDSSDYGLVWAGAMSRVIENQNTMDMEDLHNDMHLAIERLLRGLPSTLSP